MNINGIGSSDATSALSQLTTSSVARASSVPPPGGGSSSISKPGEFLSKLNQLAQQDPAKFKEVAAKLSDELKTAAGKSSGPQADFLNKLADGLSQAASSGNLSALQPPQGGPPGGAAGRPHHHHGGHHGGGGGDVKAALSSALDEVNQALEGEASTTTASASS